LAGEWLGFGHFVSLNPKMEIAAKERKDRKEKEQRTKLHSDGFTRIMSRVAVSKALILRSLRSFAAVHSRF
jgi:hypothetical protein